MEDTKQLTLVGNETPEQAEAIGLHYEIVSAAQAAASSLLDLGRKLKRMRDSGKYKALGFETFGDYTEQAVHIRRRSPQGERGLKFHDVSPRFTAAAVAFHKESAG